MQQTWEDSQVSSEFSEVADAMYEQKRYAAHYYLSSKCDVTSIDQ